MAAGLSSVEALSLLLGAVREVLSVDAERLLAEAPHEARQIALSTARAAHVYLPVCAAAALVLALAVGSAHAAAVWPAVAVLLGLAACNVGVVLERGARLRGEVHGRACVAPRRASAAPPRLAAARLPLSRRRFVSSPFPSAGAPSCSSSSARRARTRRASWARRS
jgi:hypothetical protein